ncbi:hypothetical protein CKCE_0785 [Candidatus Kinetoplastibacterium crithidii (ex Angomonas deanei ATCC 30255)]|nr:hypothetical protein CKCE_0785 [Candidatus Kinetoplastibacterium crithidii (ex Angomonas deanei ATCC 30255)]
MFEGWFSSHTEYEEQISKNLITCPICSSSEISKLLSTPYIGKKRSSSTIEKTHTNNIHNISLEQQAKTIESLRQIINKAENVGNNFAEEARLIHSGESQKTSIKGNISLDEKKELEEEGINIIPIPNFLDDDLLQ